MGRTYEIDVVRRNGQGQTKDDYHATVTRVADRHQLIFISDYRWLLDRKITKRALDRAFRRHDKREMRLGERRRYIL